jgi:hypothetical protein
MPGFQAFYFAKPLILPPAAEAAFEARLHRGAFFVDNAINIPSDVNVEIMDKEADRRGVSGGLIALGVEQRGSVASLMAGLRI